jgi:high-affinity K+ transport system ATPase subunit B
VTTVVNRATILVSELHAMLSESMEKSVYKTFVFLVLTIMVFSAVAQPTVAKPEASTQATEVSKETKSEITQKDVEPASLFVPSEKLRADDAISFPVDI